MATQNEAPTSGGGNAQKIGSDTDSPKASTKRPRRRPRPRCTCEMLDVRCEVCRGIAQRRAAAERRRLGGGK